MEYKVSEFILKLYQHTSLIDENDFQEWAVTFAKELIPFDSAQWAEGNVDKVSGPIVHRVFLHNLPEDKLAVYAKLHESGKIRDDLVLALVNNPSTTLCWRDVGESDESFWDTPIYNLYAVNYNIEYVISTAVPHFNSSFFSALSFFRSDRLLPFTEQEKHLKNIITPHLVESYRICLHTHILSKIQEAGHSAVALVNPMGAIFLKMDGFDEVCYEMKHEALLNDTIIDKELLANITTEYSGFYNKVRLTSKKLPNNLFLVVLHHDPIFKKVSPREMEAMTLFRQGKTYQEIAKIMNISKNTVSQFLRNVREKLEVPSIRKINDREIIEN